MTASAFTEHFAHLPDPRSPIPDPRSPIPASPAPGSMRSAISSLPPSVPASPGPMTTSPGPPGPLPITPGSAKGGSSPTPRLPRTRSAISFSASTRITLPWCCATGRRSSPLPRRPSRRRGGSARRPGPLCRGWQGAPPESGSDAPPAAPAHRDCLVQRAATGARPGSGRPRPE